MVPDSVAVDYVGMGAVMDFTRGTSYEMNIPLIGVKDAYLKEVPDLVRERGWQGVVVMGAPVQLLNPGLLEDLQALLNVPVTTAANASATALRSLGVHRLLLMTPWDDTVDSLLRDYLAGHGLEAVSPRQKPFTTIAEGLALPPEQVFDLTVASFNDAPGFQGVYFQAPLASGPVLERLEQQLGAPVVTSNIAGHWHVLSLLGVHHHASGYGRLLSEWPEIAAG